MLRRVILTVRAQAEALRGIDLPSGHAAGARSAHLFGPCNAFPAMLKGINGANHIWDLTQLADTWGGEIMRWLDGVSVHNHRIHSRLGSYDNVLPALNDNTLANAWRFQERAMSYWPASERQYKPVMNDEGGTYYDSLPGTWNGGDIVVPSITSRGRVWAAATSHALALRSYRDHMQFLAHLWFACVREVKYNISHSGAPVSNRWDPRPASIGADDRPFAPLPDWALLNAILDPTAYDHGRNNFPNTFPVKPWTEFNDPRSWGVYIDMGRAGQGVALVDPPWEGWRHISFGTGAVPPGEVEMRGWTLAGEAPRNLIMRPAWLAHPGRQHLFRCKINFPAGTTNTARAKIRVRGHNKLWGLENLEAEVRGGNTAPGGGTGPDNWATVEVPFQHVGHGLTHIPPVNYALLCCDHNAVGTVRWKDPELLVS
jgi:hypothetical protein